MKRIGEIAARLVANPIELVAAANQKRSTNLNGRPPSASDSLPMPAGMDGNGKGGEPPVVHGPDGSPAPTAVAAQRLSVEGGPNASNGKGKDGRPKSPAEFNRGETTAAERHGGCVLRVLSGGKGMGTVHRRNGFPRPAVPRPLLSVIEGGHALKPSLSA